MAQLGLYVDVGQTFSKGGAVAGNNGKSWYVVQHPYKGGGEITQWGEMIVTMGTTTYDVHRVTKDLSGVVPETYENNTGLANASWESTMKELGGHCYFVLVDTADLADIITEWSA